MGIDEVKEAERRKIDAILEQLTSREPQQAWRDFLENYSSVILQVIRLFESDADHVADCFLFVCEQLSRNQCGRLRKFRPGGPATFATWLRAVVRHSCVDWHRQQFGRERVFQSIAQLSALDQGVFRLVFERGMPLDQAFSTLGTQFPALTERRLSESVARVRECLTPRQMWLLSARNTRLEAFETAAGQDSDTTLDRFPDPAPNPEALAESAQRRAALVSALARLSKPERLLIRLRFEEELTLDQIARLTGLRDPQAVDRRIRQILDGMRKRLGKTPATSV
jgi:RNA polymerase sigma factor (sigma-70 family)